MHAYLTNQGFAFESTRDLQPLQGLSAYGPREEGVVRKFLGTFLVIAREGNYLTLLNTQSVVYPRESTRPDWDLVLGG